jgi:hypothetical protein
MELSIKITVSWDLMPCNLADGYQPAASICKQIQEDHNLQILRYYQLTLTFRHNTETRLNNIVTKQALRPSHTWHLTYLHRLF